MTEPSPPDDTPPSQYIDNVLGVQKLLAGGCSDKLVMQLTGISSDELRRIKNLIG